MPELLLFPTIHFPSDLPTSSFIVLTSPSTLPVTLNTLMYADLLGSSLCVVLFLPLSQPKWNTVICKLRGRCWLACWFEGNGGVAVKMFTSHRTTTEINTGLTKGAHSGASHKPFLHFTTFLPPSHSLLNYNYVCVVLQCPFCVNLTYSGQQERCVESVVIPLWVSQLLGSGNSPVWEWVGGCEESLPMPLFLIDPGQIYICGCCLAYRTCLRSCESVTVSL